MSHSSQNQVMARPLRIEIAEIIASRFGLNHLHRYPEGARALDYIEWKRRCLGIYPLFWFRSDYPTSIQRLTGKVGEILQGLLRRIMEGRDKHFLLPV